MRTVFDSPVLANGASGFLGRGDNVADVVGRLVGIFPKSRGRRALEGVALNADDAGNMLVPFAAGQRLAWQKDLIGSRFVAQALVFIDRAGLFARLGYGAQIRDCGVECRLVVLDLSDQVDTGASGLFEGFFWQCMASTVRSAYFAQGRPAFHGMSVHGFTPGWSSAREAGRSRLSLSDVCGSSSRRLSTGPRAGSLKPVRAGRWVTGWDEAERSALGFSDPVTT